MLSPAERDLIRRDPALPALATLLDEATLLAALRSALPDLGVTGAALGYLRYKPGTNAVAGYLLSLPEGPHSAYAKSFGPADRPKVTRALRRSAQAGLPGTELVALHDGATLLRIFPTDAALPGLSPLIRSTRGESTSVTGDQGMGRLTELRYKPERRWVGRFDPAAGGPSLVLKLHARRRFAASVAAARAFQDDGPLRLAPLRLEVPQLQLIGLGWLPGRLLSDALGECAATPGMLTTVGRALARLHGQAGIGLPALPREREAATLEATAAGVAWLLPPLGGRITALATRLADRVRAAPVLQRPIHGDFYAKQVLLDGEHAGVLDLDSAALGDPALDLGLFLAHLERDRLRGGPVASPALIAAFLDGYREEAGRVPGRLALYTAIALLRLTPDPFRHREPDWEERTARLLDRAESLAAALDSEVAA